MFGKKAGWDEEKPSEESEGEAESEGESEETDFAGARMEMLAEAAGIKDLGAFRKLLDACKGE